MSGWVAEQSAISQNTDHLPNRYDKCRLTIFWLILVRGTAMRRTAPARHITAGFSARCLVAGFSEQLIQIIMILCHVSFFCCPNPKIRPILAFE